MRSKEQNANILTKTLTRVNFGKTEQDLAFTRRLSLENNLSCIRGLTFEAGIKEGLSSFGFCLPSDHVYSNQFFFQVLLAMALCCVFAVFPLHQLLETVMA